MLPYKHIWVSSPVLHPSPSFFGWRSNISAGVDTTSSTIGTFFLAMVCYPEAQKEAQAELDNVLNGRLPEHNDFASLPYLSALVKEVYRCAAVCSESSLFLADCVSRWEPVLPLGWPLLVSNIVRSWPLCPVKLSRICQPATISTTTIISPPILLWSPTNGDSCPISNFPLYLNSTP